MYKNEKKVKRTYYKKFKPFQPQILEEYNEKGSKLKMVLFNDALEHLTRVHRTIRQHRGHVLVVGIGGSGKQSVIRLAAFAANCEIFEITLNRGYNENSFREDMKILYNKVGVENKRTVFLFTAAHIVDESFLEIVNNMLMIDLFLSKKNFFFRKFNKQKNKLHTK